MTAALITSPAPGAARVAGCERKILAAIVARRREWTYGEIAWLAAANYSPAEREAALDLLVAHGKLSLTYRYSPSARNRRSRVYALTPLATAGGGGEP